MTNKNLERDLWWEARQRTAKESQPGIIKQILRVVTTSLPGKPVATQIVPTALADRKDVVWFPDLNLYRPFSLRPYFDAGCKAAMVRIGGPKYWSMDNWQYTIDPSFKPLMDEAEKLGMRNRIIGYWVHNPFEYRDIGADGMTRQTRKINEFTAGGYMPKSLCYDHEITKCWLGTGAEFPCTAWNQTESLRINTATTAKNFSKDSIPVYSAMWFLKFNADYWEYHYNRFYNDNRPSTEGGVGVTRPLMLAWYPGVKSTPYTSMTDLANDLIVPTSEQIKNYLFCGFQANSWQFTDRLNIGGKYCDFNVSLDPSGTFYKVFGLDNADPVIPPEPEPTPGIRLRVTANTLNIRSGPGQQYADIGDLHAGDVVTAQGIEGPTVWVEIEPGKWACKSLNGVKYMGEVDK